MAARGRQCCISTAFLYSFIKSSHHSLVKTGHAILGVLTCCSVTSKGRNVCHTATMMCVAMKSFQRNPQCPLFTFNER